MRIQFVGAILLVASFISGPAVAQENGPMIIPEQLQELALKFPVAKRLNINWSKAGPNDVGRYLGFLAAVNEVAITLANSNDRKEPAEADFLAALSIQCIWPTNKPPFVEKSWPLQAPAFYDASVRAAIRQAVGPTAKELPARIEKLGKVEYAKSGGVLPTRAAEYYRDVFDIQKLSRAK